jgi:hypothetical protein
VRTKFTSEAIDRPGSIESKENTKGSIERINKSNLICVLEDLFVNDSAVAVESSLASDLLSAVDDHSEQEALADRGILPQSRVAGRNSLSLKFHGLTDGKNFILDFLIGITNTSERVAGVLDAVTMLNVPTGSFRNKPELCEDEDGYEQLEYDNHPPVPLAQLDTVLGASEIHPVRNERADTVEHLPERHDSTTDLRRGKFSDVYRAGSCMKLDAVNDRPTW